jgi:alpha-beta hydrolase superfamily lysophospholipase
MPMRAASRLVALLVVLLASGCGPTSLRYADVQPQGDLLADHWSLPAATLPVEDTYVTADGAELGFLAYRRDEPAGTAMIYIHGIESHAGWFDPAARALQRKGYDVFCLDRRGSGINRENRGFTSGFTESFDLLVADVHVFMQALQEHYEDIVLIGLSWGGKYAATYANTYPDRPDGLVEITPGTFPLVDLTFGQKLSVLWNNTFGPKHQIPTPIEPEMFTTDPELLEFIKNDPLRLRTATARFFMESRRMDRYLAHVTGRFEGPLLLLLADGDRIIDNDKTRTLLTNAYPDQITVKIYEDQTHSIQLEATAELTADIDSWVKTKVLAGGGGR